MAEGGFACLFGGSTTRLIEGGGQCGIVFALALRFGLMLGLGASTGLLCRVLLRAALLVLAGGLGQGGLKCALSVALLLETLSFSFALCEGRSNGDAHGLVHVTLWVAG